MHSSIHATMPPQRPYMLICSTYLYVGIDGHVTHFYSMTCIYLYIVRLEHIYIGHVIHFFIKKGTTFDFNPIDSSFYTTMFFREISESFYSTKTFLGQSA